MASLRNLVETARSRFHDNTRGHVMTVGLDDGIYRHLKFRQPDRSMYWFNITTVPGSLMFQGDVGTFVFSRSTDMFEFFGAGPQVNPDYWAQKVTAGEPMWYSPDLLKQTLRERFVDLCEWQDWDEAQIEDFRDELDNLVEDLPGETLSEDLAWVDANVPAELEALNVDLWDGSYMEPTSQFLWCCHAVVYAVNRYRNL